MEVTICKRCVMDNSSDDSIIFDESGYCNYCSDALGRMDNVYFPNEEGIKKFDQMIDLLKSEGKGKRYDCMMGLSGGLDSSYLAYLGAKKNLRILGIHIDDGFNTIVAEANIRKLSEACKLDLVIEKLDREQYMDLTRAFIRAGLPSIAIPQDNILTACLYKHAKLNGIKYFLSGANFALESILQRGNSHNAADKTHIISISKEFGEKGIDKLTLISLFEKYISNRYFNKILTIRPLDFIHYNKESAIKELEDFCGYNYYGGKHYESIICKFAQAYYLPHKFKFDKRKSHYSSLIVSGQMTRDEALAELRKPLYDKEEMNDMIDKILESLQMSREEFDSIMQQPPKLHQEYKASFLNNFKGIARKYRSLFE